MLRPPLATTRVLAATSLLPRRMHCPGSIAALHPKALPLLIFPRCAMTASFQWQEVSPIQHSLPSRANRPMPPIPANESTRQPQTTTSSSLCSETTPVPPKWPRLRSRRSTPSRRNRLRRLPHPPGSPTNATSSRESSDSWRKTGKPNQAMGNRRHHRARTPARSPLVRRTRCSRAPVSRKPKARRVAGSHRIAPAPQGKTPALQGKAAPTR